MDWTRFKVYFAQIFRNGEHFNVTYRNMLGREIGTHENQTSEEVRSLVERWSEQNPMFHFNMYLH